MHVWHVARSALTLAVAGAQARVRRTWIFMSERSDLQSDGGPEDAARTGAASAPAKRNVDPSTTASGAGSAPRLRAQVAIGEALSCAVSREELFHALLAAALDGVGACRASLALIGARGDALEVIEAAASSRGIAKRSLALSAPAPVARAARDGRPLFAESPSDSVSATADGGPSHLSGASGAVPLIVAGRTLGAFAVEFDEPHAFRDDERAFLFSIAHLAAESIERLRSQEGERSARVEVERARHSKNEFLATVSHEIRTPLNAIVGYTELLEMQLGGPLSVAQQGYLHRIRASSTHLLGIINDMLDLAKVEAGRLLVTHKQVSARKVIESALALVHPQATARSVVLLSRCDAEREVLFRGDERRAEQIVLNLLSNAVRFTEAGGRITVGCRLVATAAGFRLAAARVARRWCAIEVADTGIGIAAEHLAMIFDPFVQVQSGHARSYGGAGLGLAISRRLARLMDGDVTVESTVDTGSTFTLWLPAAEDESRIPAPADKRTGATPAPGLSEVGDAVLNDVSGIVERYMARLRQDPMTPSAHAMGETDLSDHTGTFVTDIAHALGIIEEQAGTGSPLLRHDHEIQQLIADRHGELRRQLGWGQAELERDFEILWEEVQAAVRSALPAEEPGVVAGLTQLEQFFNRAFAISRRAYQREAQTPSNEQRPSG
jgi:signal transduction histidine kinase